MEYVHRFWFFLYQKFYVLSIVVLFRTIVLTLVQHWCVEVCNSNYSSCDGVELHGFWC